VLPVRSNSPVIGAKTACDPVSKKILSVAAPTPLASISTGIEVKSSASCEWSTGADTTIGPSGAPASVWATR